MPVVIRAKAKMNVGGQHYGKSSVKRTWSQRNPLSSPVVRSAELQVVVGVAMDVDPNHDHFVSQLRLR